MLNPSRASLLLSAGLALALTACSGSPERKTVTYPAGDKAAVDRLSYNVVDTQILPRIGDDSSPRTPQTRFYVVDLAVFNSGNADAPIPALQLIDDSGKVYDELADGSGVPHWLGVVRRVQPNQAEQGAVVFDAPAGHYKLKLTDETDPSDVFIDLPLSFAHEQMQNDTQATSEAVTVGTPEAAPQTQPAPKKK